MRRSIEEIKDILIARYDPDQLIDILEPDIEELVEGCHDIIIDREEKLQILFDQEEVDESN